MNAALHKALTTMTSGVSLVLGIHGTALAIRRTPQSCPVFGHICLFLAIFYALCSSDFLVADAKYQGKGLVI